MDDNQGHTQMNPDLNNDGQVTDQETLIVERKMRVQRRIAIAAFTINVIFAVVLIVATLSGHIDDKADELDALLSMWWVGSWGIIAAYFGVEGWLNKR